MRVWPVLFLAACGGGAISVSPSSVDLGEIDFNMDRPDSGYGLTEVALENTGSGAVVLQLRDVDEERIQVQVRLASEEPPTLPALDPGDTLVMTVGAWDYEPGELDTAVTGQFRLTSSDLRDDVTVPWSFTPIRTGDE